ncbi:uncharacterized protein isoform X2 [Leptinotarsa decemlineata]|uniref:uncharacterized protein isoform X2 n=1 Tax=Leptinotarsa decemlineata TaxID=7539 RepID=UPI003D304C1D
MEQKQYYKYCIVPLCTNTSIKSPNKIFIRVPEDDRNRRIKWLNACKRNKNDISHNNKALHVCEDHFNLEEDMENYIKFKLMGAQKKMKPDVIPHIFNCQSDRKRAFCHPPRPAALKIIESRIVDDAVASTSTSVTGNLNYMKIELQAKISWDMASLECERQIKREVQSVDDEVPFQKHDVKSEPSEAEMFSECERNGDASDANMSTNDLDEHDELKVNMHINKFDPEEITIEETFFTPYFDLKSEKCENAMMEGSNLKACEELFSHENGSSNSRRNHNESHAILFGNMTEDLKPSVGFTTDSGNIFVETKEETIFEKKEEIMEFAVENDHVKHGILATTVNEQYNSINCLNLKTSEKPHSGEKTFRCKICSKSFARTDALKYHEKLHFGEKTVSVSNMLKIVQSKWCFETS